MIKFTDAMAEVRSSIKSILEAAGMVSGLSLTQAEITSETDPIFWETVIRSKPASDKSKYCVYDIASLLPQARGDGAPVLRKAIVNLNLVALEISDLMTMASLIDTHSASWRFEMTQPIDFDPESKTYSMRCELVALVGE